MLARLATADLAAVQTAAGNGRILQDTSAAVYGPIAMPGNVSDLLRLYEFARDAANRAAEAIDLPAIAARTPSSYLAVMRSAPAPVKAPASEQALDPGMPRLRLLTAAGEVKQQQMAAQWRASFPGRPMPGAAPSRADQSRSTRPVQPRHSRMVR